MPVKVCEAEFTGRFTSQKSSQVVAGHQDRHNCQRRVDPGAGNAGHFVEAEEECQRNGKRGVQAEEGGETDKNPHRKTGGNVAGMGIKGEYFFELLLDCINVYHNGPGCRQQYDFDACFVNLIDFTIRPISDIKRVE